eukprot:3570460-Rhodomonas_salina.1
MQQTATVVLFVLRLWSTAFDLAAEGEIKYKNNTPVLFPLHVRVIALDFAPALSSALPTPPSPPGSTIACLSTHTTID